MTTDDRIKVTVEKMDKNRIETVRLLLPEPPADAADDAEAPGEEHDRE